MKTSFNQRISTVGDSGKGFRRLKEERSLSTKTKKKKSTGVSATDSSDLNTKQFLSSIDWDTVTSRSDCIRKLAGIKDVDGSSLAELQPEFLVNAAFSNLRTRELQSVLGRIDSSGNNKYTYMSKREMIESAVSIIIDRDNVSPNEVVVRNDSSNGSVVGSLVSLSPDSKLTTVVKREKNDEDNR